MTPLNRLTLIILLLAPLAACSDPPPQIYKSMEGRKAAPTEFVKMECDPSVHPFWKKFRAAVLAGDTEAVADMAWFPVRIIDPLSIADRELSRAEFIEQFPEFLKAKPDEGSPGEKPAATMKELLKEAPTLSKDACRDYKTLLLFNRWTFQLSGDNRWRLDRVDISDEAPVDIPTVDCKPSIHPFWTKFRAAVLAEDAEAVADMTHFPLGIATGKEGRGGPLSREEFIKRFPQFLNAPAYPGRPGEKPPTMKELLKEVPTLAKDACAPFETILAFERWTFQLREEDRWKLDSVETRTFTK